MTITVSPEVEERLRQQAKLEGKDIGSVADRLLADALDWQARDREETLEGIRAGLRDVEAGRVKPAEEVFDRLRALLAQHGL